MRNKLKYFALFLFTSLLAQANSWGAVEARSILMLKPEVFEGRPLTFSADRYARAIENAGNLEREIMSEAGPISQERMSELEIMAIYRYQIEQCQREARPSCALLGPGPRGAIAILGPNAWATANHVVAVMRERGSIRAATQRTRAILTNLAVVRVSRQNKSVVVEKFFAPQAEFRNSTEQAITVKQVRIGPNGTSRVPLNERNVAQSSLEISDVAMILFDENLARAEISQVPLANPRTGEPVTALPDNEADVRERLILRQSERIDDLVNNPAMRSILFLMPEPLTLLNRGDSGRPLVNERQELLGIITQGTHDPTTNRVNRVISLRFNPALLAR